MKRPLRSRADNRRGVLFSSGRVLRLLVFFMAVLESLVCFAAEGEETPEEIAAAMRDARKHLLQLPGGWAMHYKLSVTEAEPSKPQFVFPEIDQGLLAVRWPRIRSRIAAKMYTFVDKPGGNVERQVIDTVREGDYDFELQVGAGREGTSIVQHTNFRHAFSANLCYPLVFQYFSEMDQHYVVGETLETEYWLPDAIEQHSYSIVGRKEVDGIPCIVLERQDYDTIYVAEKHGYVVCQRDLRYGPGRPLRESVKNVSLKEIAPDVWIPMRQTKALYDSRSGKLRYRLTLDVTKIDVGQVADAMLYIEIPQNAEAVEDFVLGQSYRRLPGDNASYEAILRNARRLIQLRGRPQATWTFLYAGLAILLAALIVLVFLRTSVTRTR